MSNSPSSDRALLRACHKDVRPLLRQLMDAGGSVRITKANHLMVALGDRREVLSLTPRSPSASVYVLQRMLKAAK